MAVLWQTEDLAGNLKPMYEVSNSKSDQLQATTLHYSMFA